MAPSRFRNEVPDTASAGRSARSLAGKTVGVIVLKSVSYVGWNSRLTVCVLGATSLCAQHTVELMYSKCTPGSAAGIITPLAFAVTVSTSTHSGPRPVPLRTSVALAHQRRVRSGNPSSH
eukprot:1642566-Rhodomonas_salina.3